jgi:transcriptional regulator with XRE-family HTH domain
MDDRTVGLVLRGLRRRRGWPQHELARRVGMSQSVVSRVEAGHLGGVTVDRLRRLFAGVEARLEMGPRWRGAELERLLDEAHAEVVAAVATVLESFGWAVAVEVTYSEYGERGSIDILATKAARRAALVVEVKTDLPSAEQVGRKVDEKARLAPRIVERRDGSRPETVGRVLVMPESAALRRRFDATPVLHRLFPLESRAMRRWLKEPVGSAAGRWFLSGIAARHRGRVVWRRDQAPAPTGVPLDRAAAAATRPGRTAT